MQLIINTFGASLRKQGEQFLVQAKQSTGKGRRGESITTRIETTTKRGVTATVYGGRRGESITTRIETNLLQVVSIVNILVEEVNPSQQGLKPISLPSLIRGWEVEEVNPSQQGLKLHFVGGDRRGLGSSKR